MFKERRLSYSNFSIKFSLDNEFCVKMCNYFNVLQQMDRCITPVYHFLLPILMFDNKKLNNVNKV